MTLFIQTAISLAKINALVPEYVPANGDLTPTGVVNAMIEKYGLMAAIQKSFSVVHNDRATLALLTYLFLEAQDSNDTALYVLMNAVGKALYDYVPRPATAVAFGNLETDHKVLCILTVLTGDKEFPLQTFYRQVEYSAMNAKDEEILSSIPRAA